MITPNNNKPAQQAGFTLVELMVAMSIGLLIVLGAVSGIIIAKGGFTTVDTASQLRDNVRFSTEIISRIAVESGFKDLAFALADTPDVVSTQSIEPSIIGFNNAILSPSSTGGDPSPSLASDTRTATAGGCPTSADTACVNGSDILVLRFQPAEVTPGSGIADKTMVNCLGVPIATASTTIDDQVTSIFHVARVENGEPALMCASQMAAGAWISVPIVSGVESFQVLYGTDGVVPNTVPTAIQDSIADRYLRADQLVVPGNAAATTANWRRVRSLRIGLLVRGAKFSAPDVTSAAGPYFPLGQAMAGVNDPGTKFTAQMDGRLRQASTFTIHLRNTQDR